MKDALLREVPELPDDAEGTGRPVENQGDRQCADRVCQQIADRDWVR